MRIDVITIFPDYLAPLELSLVGKARAAGVLDIRVHDLRNWSTDRHRTVDDTPYGGGAGMVMKPDVWGAALDSVTDRREAPAGDNGSAQRVSSLDRPRLVVPTPSGRVLDQELAAELAAERWLVFACGRYEGIDARVVEDAATRMPVTELSIGDYVLSGGEVAALVTIEAVTRLLPGVMGNPDSLVEESHGVDGLLEYPVYTKPPTWRGRDVPEILVSGHHARVARWRRDQALSRTAARRPDLVERLEPEAFDRRDLEVLADLGWIMTDDGPRRPRDSAS